MTTIDELAAIASGLPCVELTSKRGERAWIVSGTTFAWVRPLRTRDLEELGDAAPRGDVVAIRVADESSKLLLLEQEAPAVFATAHLDGYPIVLLDLDLVDRAVAADLLTDAWWAASVGPLPDRLRLIVDALPLTPGMRVLEIGCGTGAAARYATARVAPTGVVLAIDRSTRAIDQAARSSRPLTEQGALSLRCSAAHELALGPDEAPFDLAFANRVGALDGRHAAQEAASIKAIRSMLTDEAPLFIDGVRSA